MDLLRRWMRMFIEKSLGGNHESGGAEAALLGVVFHKGSLHGMKLLALHQALDCNDGLVLRLDGQHRTGVHRFTIHKHGTGAAGAPVADALRAGDFKILPQRVK